MPQFGTPNASVSFPGWVLPSHLTNIAWHPHPATVRATGRTVTKADDKLRPWASRHYGRLSWGPDQPIGPGYELPNWEWFWFDMVPVEPHFSKGSTGTSATSNRVDIEQRYLDAMPLTGQAGVQILHTFFSRGEIIGSRFTEFPDNASPFQYDTGTSVPASAGATRAPADDIKPGDVDFRHFESWPVPECWRWWNTHQLTACQLEIDPAGIGSKLVKLSGFNWVNGLGTGGKITSAQRRFADLINRSHVVEPVWYGGGLGWYPCWLQRIGGPVFDQEASWPFPPDDSGRYDFAVTLEARPDAALQFIRFDVRLHVKMSPGKSTLIWPVIPFGSDTKFWDQFGGWSGQLFRAFHAGMSTGLPWDPPQDLSDLDAFGIVDETITRDSTPSWGDLMTDGFVSLSEVPAQETVGPPQQGPIAMPTMSQKRVLAIEEGLGPSAHGSPKMKWGSFPVNVGGWSDPLQPTRLVVPSEVRAVRLFGHGMSSSGTAGGALNLLLNGTHITPNGFRYIDDPGGTQQMGAPVCHPWVDVSEGDYFELQIFRWQETISTDTRFNWLYAESIDPRSQDEHQSLVAAGVPIPAVNTTWDLLVVPTALDGFWLRKAMATFIDEKATVGDLILDLRVIREGSRAAESLTTNPIQIDANDWHSLDSSFAFAPAPITAQVFQGDVIYAELLNQPTGGKGLIVNINLEESI